MAHDDVASAQSLFDGWPLTLAILARVERAVADLGVATVRVTKSQVAFRRRRGFAYVWRPGQYVRSDVPAVLSIALAHRTASARFKTVVHPSPTVWMHHLELHGPDEVDDEVRAWLAKAYADAE